jgi:hypothetical protein
MSLNEYMEIASSVVRLSIMIAVPVMFGISHYKWRSGKQLEALRYLMLTVLMHSMVT